MSLGDANGEIGRTYPPLWVKRPHRKGCLGRIVNRHERVCVDRVGRVGNGGIVAHEYRCNMRWDGCEARVLIAERTIRGLAAEALGEVVLSGGTGPS